MSGLFITMEGTDGSGKTTQINLLCEYLEQKGYEVVCTREPGGTFISEKIRNILIDEENKKMDYMTEALLYAAARAQLVNEVIEPALKNGAIVISDRFTDSSIVYQGIARGIGEDIIYNINSYAVNGLEPDITFLMRLDGAQGIERKRKQDKLDRIEQTGNYFHKKVFYGYGELAEKYPKRIKVIDASKKINDIHSEIVGYVENLIESFSF